MGNLEDRIVDLWDNRASLDPADKAAKQTIREAIDLLDPARPGSPSSSTTTSSCTSG